MHRVLLACLAFLCVPLMANAQDQAPTTLQSILQEHQALVAKPSRRTIGTVLDELAASGLPQVPGFLNRYAEKDVWLREEDGLFFYGAKSGDGYNLTDIDSDEVIATAVPSDGLKNIKPNGSLIPISTAAAMRWTRFPATPIPRSSTRWPPRLRVSRTPR